MITVTLQEDLSNWSRQGNSTIYINYIGLGKFILRMPEGETFDTGSLVQIQMMIPRKIR